MLRQAVQGARWYQHVARRRPTIPPLRPHAFSAAAPRSINYGGPDDKIRFYEQVTRGSKTRRRVDPEAEDRDERRDMQEELAKLDDELEILKEGPYGPNSPFIQGLPEKDRAIALEALRKYEEEHGKGDPEYSLDQVFDEKLDDALRQEFEGLAREEENWQTQGNDDDAQTAIVRQPYEVVLEDSDQGAYIDKFNDSLRRSAKGRPNELLAQELWKWYRRCKQLVPGFVQSIPEEGFDLLWNSTNTTTSAPSRAAHIQTLAEDILAVGKPLSTPHTLAYIESIQGTGKTDAALDQWEAHQSSLSQKKEDLEAYWKLGVQIFSAEGDPQRAQDIALAFLANTQSRDARILIPVILAWGRQPGKEPAIKAWSLYLQLKAFLEHQPMTMEDYDRISIGFLKTNRLSLAIAVFKDMMVTGQDSANDSTSLYQKAVGLAGNLQASSISERDVNKVSLATLTVLPRRFQNRFFYASWMKKLIGMGEVDSAAMVIELMYERGVNPDPKHLNGLIAAWLRETNTSSREKAERLGWAMIQRRIDTVWARAKPSVNSPRVEVNHEVSAARIPKFMQRPMPSANIETFSILLLHYTRRGDEDMTQHLVKCLDDAQIRPNSYFMNHLLYAELRKQDIRSLWNKFKSMSALIQPDLETYACLWDCGKLQYDRGRTAFVSGFPSARHLYAEMMHWYSQLSGRGKAVAHDEFSKELYDQIVRCLCLSKDPAGTLVALCSMRAIFGIAPDDTTARLIVLQVARMAGVPAETPKRRLRRLSSTPRSKENIAHVNRLVEILSERKLAALQARGLTLDTLEPQEREQYQLEIMIELLRVVMGRSAAEPSRVENDIAGAATEMGVAAVDFSTSLADDDLLL
ncbi:pentatricopeptide repeat protein [Aspergillus steynii IBT 23096]|uniref:Pentatricopeptide repeat protein n=1 Tax=Aspergillus steynii IBT 23096 TaxID=1392250 RepID=A0A2I2FVQ9_9EURO|nr:pentatricopeptide repeat protein [Aspergillus steynii IBT 23096]PLB44720.1 pentatricopeptide repeat protein [Aspergillus steynii IBT 23096]